MWTIVVHNAAGQEMVRTVLKRGVIVTVGRAPDCTITLGAMSVARKQGQIELRAGVPTWFDAEDASGVRFDGALVRGSVFLSQGKLLEIAGFRLTVQRMAGLPETKPMVPPPSPAPARPAPPPELSAPAAPPEPTGQDPMELLLEQKIEGVRAHRRAHGGDLEAERAMFEEQWNEILQHARRMERGMLSRANVQSFGVARDGSELSVKIRDNSPRGHCYFILARAHPEGKYPDLMAAWLSEVGVKERSFREPKHAFEELLAELAPRLA